MKLRYLAVALLAITVAAAGIVVARRPGTFAFHYDNVIGTSLDITLRAASEDAAHRAEAAVLNQIDRDAKILSAYDPESEFSQWFRTQDTPVHVSRELLTVLGLFDEWRDRTGGALDASAENVSSVWKAAALRQQVPSDAELAAAVARVRQRHWTLDRAAGTATHLTTAPLMLASFTKSYMIQRAVDAALGVPTVDAAVVNIGGDLVARGPWTGTVGVIDPQRNADNAPFMTTLDVRDLAVATSGGYRRGFDIAGTHYSHIVDPRTGRPTGHILSSTVVARDAVNAGALATAFCVLAPEDSEALAATIPGTEFLLVLADGSRIESPGWRQLQRRPSRAVSLPDPVASLSAAEQTWNTGMELTVAVELARQFGRRPYLAVWIEDKDKFPVRTLALWFDKYRYLREMRAWSRSDRLRALAEGTEIVDSVSSATRSPGKYTFTWDGKDGHGKFVKPGVYTVLIEAAREHGTYQILRQEIDVSGAAKHVDFPSNAELASASVDYHTVSAPAR